MTPVSLSASTLNSVQNLRRGEDSSSQRSQSTPLGRGVDRVELSDAARAAAADQAPVRLDLVTRVREQISSGTYDTPERTSVAVDDMTRALRNG